MSLALNYNDCTILMPDPVYPFFSWFSLCLLFFFLFLSTFFSSSCIFKLEFPIDSTSFHCTFLLKKKLRLLKLIWYTFVLQYIPHFVLHLPLLSCSNVENHLFNYSFPKMEHNSYNSSLTLLSNESIFCIWLACKEWKQSNELLISEIIIFHFEERKHLRHW